MRLLSLRAAAAGTALAIAGTAALLLLPPVDVAARSAAAQSRLAPVGKPSRVQVAADPSAKDGFVLRRVTPQASLTVTGR